MLNTRFDARYRCAYAYKINEAVRFVFGLMEQFEITAVPHRAMEIYYKL